jgi:myosin-crossreactive antigen
MSHHAHMIGAGIGNLAAAVYLIAAYHFLGLPASRLTKINRYDRDPRVLLKATQTMFR